MKDLFKRSSPFLVLLALITALATALSVPGSASARAPLFRSPSPLYRTSGITVYDVAKLRAMPGVSERSLEGTMSQTVAPSRGKPRYTVVGQVIILGFFLHDPFSQKTTFLCGTPGGMVVVRPATGQAQFVAGLTVNLHQFVTSMETEGTGQALAYSTGCYRYETGWEWWIVMTADGRWTPSGPMVFPPRINLIWDQSDDPKSMDEARRYTT
jgi:hypothetical protein